MTSPTATTWRGWLRPPAPRVRLRWTPASRCVRARSGRGLCTEGPKLWSLPPAPSVRPGLGPLPGESAASGRGGQPRPSHRRPALFWPGSTSRCRKPPPRVQRWSVIQPSASNGSPPPGRRYGRSMPDSMSSLSPCIETKWPEQSSGCASSSSSSEPSTTSGCPSTCWWGTTAQTSWCPRHRLLVIRSMKSSRPRCRTTVRSSKSASARPSAN